MQPSPKQFFFNYFSDICFFKNFIHLDKIVGWKNHQQYVNTTNNKQKKGFKAH